MEETITEAVTEAVSGTTAPEVAVQAEAVMQAVASGEVDRSVLENFWQAVLAYLPTVITAVIIYFVGVILTKIIMKIVNKAMGRTKVEPAAQHFLSSLTKAVLTAFTIIIALTILGIPMTSIITAVGAAGLAIGLALQSSLANVAGGFLILISKPFSKGDYISVGGTEGIVNSISILNTSLNTLDNKLIYIPNGSVSNSTIINFSREEKRRVDLVFGISYDSDIKHAKEVIMGAAKKHPKVLTEIEPFVRVSELADSAVKLTVRVWVKNADYWDVYFDLIEDVADAFGEQNIEIPYNKLDVNIRK